MSTFETQRELICDATPVRHFALIGQFDLFVALAGGRIYVPRPVLDPDNDIHAVQRLLSDIGRSELYWSRRSQVEDSFEKYSRLRALRQRTDIHVVDLNPEEQQAFGELQASSYARSLGFARGLGAGEAAAIVGAAARDYDAVIDDAAGRAAFGLHAPAQRVMTTREFLRSRSGGDLLTSPEAEVVYMDLLAGGYSGPESLWG